MKHELKNRHGLRIVGDLEKPKGEIRGTFIVQHGWGGNRNKVTIQTVKNALLDAGFQTFNFDSTHSFGESDGDFEQSTMTTFRDDFIDVTHWAQQQDWFIGPLGVSGHSKGGYAAVYYAEQFPDTVKYIVSIAPVVSGELSFEAYKKYRPDELNQWKSAGVLERVGKDGNIKRQHWRQMEERLNHNLLPDAGAITMPTLFIVGSEDQSCPPDHVQMLFDAIPSAQKNFHLIPDAPHSFYEKTEQDECARAITDWLTSIPTPM